MYVVWHLSVQWGWAPQLFLGGHAGASGRGLSSAPTSTSTSAPLHPGGSCLSPLCPGHCGGLRGPGRAQRRGCGRGPAGQIFRQVPGQWGPVCTAGSRPHPRVDETEKTVHVFTNSTRSTALFPPLPARDGRPRAGAPSPSSLPLLARAVLS